MQHGSGEGRRGLWEKGPLKRHHWRLPQPQSVFLLLPPFLIPSQQLIFQHATNIFANRSGSMGERGGWLHACSSEFRQCETCVEGSAESWRGCHNSGRESSVMPAARLAQMAVRDPRVILWGNSSRCLSYVTAQQGNGAGGTRRGAHVRGICAFIKCGCVHSVWLIWVRIH